MVYLFGMVLFVLIFLIGTMILDVLTWVIIGEGLLFILMNREEKLTTKIAIAREYMLRLVVGVTVLTFILVTFRKIISILGI